MSKLFGAMILIPILYGAGTQTLHTAAGEVAQLETIDASGGSLVTSVWVVDFQGDAWIRANSPSAIWLHRLREHPEVYLHRSDGRRAYSAEVMLLDEERLHDAMREKYGLADRAMGLFRNRDHAVAIRLDRRFEKESDSVPRVFP